jgi:osmoprotectant transport system substrate-binding protein
MGERYPAERARYRAAVLHARPEGVDAIAHVWFRASGIGALVLVLAACGGGHSARSAHATTAAAPPIVIGSKDSTEQMILAELYAQALQAHGFRVSLKKNIGPTELVDRALVSGEIQLYPEEIGEIVGTLAHRWSPASAAQSYRLARRWEKARGFTLLEPTPFVDSPALATTRAYAAAHHLRDLHDLRRLGRLRVAASPWFTRRELGLVGLRRAYGLTNLRVVDTPVGEQFDQLLRGRAELAVVSTNDPPATGGRFTLLADHRHVFGFDHCAPVVATSLLLRTGPRLADAINGVSRLLTTQVMRRLDWQVTQGHRRDSDVAMAFLRESGLTE